MPRHKAMAILGMRRFRSLTNLGRGESFNPFTVGQAGCHGTLAASVKCDGSIHTSTKKKRVLLAGI